MNPRVYSITVRGHDAERFVAPTAGKAKYMAYRAYCEATRHISFREFIDRIDGFLHMGRALRTDKQP